MRSWRGSFSSEGLTASCSGTPRMIQKSPNALLLLSDFLHLAASLRAIVSVFSADYIATQFGAAPIVTPLIMIQQCTLNPPCSIEIPVVLSLAGGCVSGK